MVWCLTVGCALACTKHEKRADRYPAQIFVCGIWLNLVPNTKNPLLWLMENDQAKGFLLPVTFGLEVKSV